MPILDYLIRKIISLFSKNLTISSLRVTNLKAVINLIIGSVIAIVFALLCLKFTESIRAKKESRKPKSLMELLNISGTYTYQEILVGMTSNMIFGFIDTGSLILGLDVLLPYLPGGEIVKAGLANTYSDVFASFLGTVIGFSIENYTGILNHPLWTKIGGIFIGCLLGTYIPAFLLGKKI